ncbi:MAG: HlyD family efflux transporter periplasmic adaptor subunit [Oscillospiraceae bacterium]|nr:HlyD family efflux transporter periplasmic adaptor subunit [Oscillospiraceae bacterium]
MEQGKTAHSAPESAAQSVQAGAFSEAVPAPKKKKKNKKKLVRRILALVLVVALAGGFFAWRKLHPSDTATAEVTTEMVMRGSITSVVRGSGAAVAKNSASITLLSDGDVREVFVSEGDYVTADTPLFEIDSSALEEELQSAQDNLREAEQALNKRQTELSKFLARPTEGDARADYAGILMLSGGQTWSAGDEISEDAVMATLVDNTKLLLSLYFSYGYENEVSVGQSATVSVPATMTQLPGVVHEVHMVERVSPEGSRLFEVVIALDNPGTLVEDMDATATISGPVDTLYPYEPGKLTYYRTTEIKAPLSGKLSFVNARSYQRVAAGESIAHIVADTENYEDELKGYTDAVDAARDSLDAAQQALEKKQEDLKLLHGVAPIDGTVLSLGITAGETAKAGTVAVSIADTSTMTVNAQIDEMNVSYAKVGMPVDINLWDQQLFGTIDSVSLTASSENGVARFPMVISVDNSEGKLMSGAYVDYSFTASQSDDCLVVPIQCVKSAQDVNGESIKVLFVQSDAAPENVVELSMDIAEIPAGFWPVAVETGISDSYNVEILSGVDEGVSVYSGVLNTQGGGIGGLYF